MPSYIGNTSGFVYGNIINEGILINSYTFVNKTGVTANANLAIKREGINVNIIPINTPIYGNMMYPSGFQPIPVEMISGDQIVLEVTAGNIDYSISYTKPNT